MSQPFPQENSWDEHLSLSQPAEARAVIAGDHDNTGWRASNAGWIHFLRGAAPAVLACAARAASPDITEARDILSECEAGSSGA